MARSVDCPGPVTNDHPSWWDRHAAVSIDFLEANFPCRAACPVGTNAGGYVSLIAQGRHEEAYLLARAPNPFASVCGRVCAHPCETVCRRGAIDAPISIRALKRFVTERYGCESARRYDDILRVVERPRPAAARPHTVAVVGAGPAGLSCAHDLALMGHKVIVYDGAKVPGGMLRLGVPEYRLPREVLDAEIDFIRFLGVEIRLGVEIGRDITFSALRETHDAVFLAPGCRRGRGLRLPGSDLPGVITAVDFLLKVNLGEPIETGERVVVVGGGNVAFDVARSANHLMTDAATMAARVLKKDVTLICLESEAEMPADREEIDEGRREGVRLLTRRGPKAVVAGPDGRVSGLQTLDVSRVFDDAGRFAPQMIDGTEKVIPADTVIFAVGQVADLTFLGDGHGLDVTPQQTVKVERETLATNVEGVWAGGDVAFGPRIAIEAVGDGRRAAKAIDSWLTGRSDAPPRYVLGVLETYGYEHPFARGDYEKTPRAHVPTIEPTIRGQRREVELGFDEALARAEGARCLHCWVNPVFDSVAMEGSECIQCGGCADVCPMEVIALVSAERVGTAATQGAAMAIVKDETRCIRCGLCARRCPTACITMQALYREPEIDLVRLAEQVL